MSEAETPWAAAKRLRAEGHPREVIVTRLKAMGLDDGDVNLLLSDHLPAPAPQDTSGNTVLTVGAMVVGGPLLGALVGAALADPGPAPTPSAPQVALDAADTSARCAWHPTLASVASCPRCGAFTCRECAPSRDERYCLQCRGSGAVRDLRITRAVRWMALWLFSITGCALFQASAWFDDGGHSLRESILTVAIGGGPFAVLALVQLSVRNLWPSVIAALCLLPVMLLVPVTYLWIAMAVVMIISALLARSELKAAHKACTGGQATP